MIKSKTFSKEDLKLLKRSFSYVNKYKVKFFTLLFSIIVIIGLGIVQPLLWGKIMQDLYEKDYSNIFINLIYTFLIYLLESIISFIKGYNEAVLNNNIVYDLKSDMYEKILNFTMNIFDKMQIGEFISRLQGDVSVLANIITNQLITVIVNLMKVIVLGIVIFKINIILSLIVLTTFPLTYILFLLFGKKLREENKKFKKLNDKYFSIIQQSLFGIKHIKTYGIKSENFIIFKQNTMKIRNKDIQISVLQNISQVISRIIGSLNNVIITGVGIYFISKGKLNIQYFIAFISYSGQFSSSLMIITQLNSHIQQVLVSLERIFGLIDNLSFSSEIFGNKEIERIKGNIEFKNVIFSYDKNKEILKKVSFKIDHNKLTAIVGKNGCGKTTILNLILGLYKVSEGEILIDGININDLNEESLRRNISVVHQQNFLFNLSIKENLRLVAANVSNEEIEEACKMVFIHDYIVNLEQKYDTIIDENASNLSGGQKQRLALAMCLLRNTPIILLDEATSALDTESKNVVNSVIKDISKFKTVIVITHNISTIMSADEIIIVDEGKKVGQGVHNSLIKNDCKYIELYKNEFTSFTEVCADMENKTT